MTRLRKEYESPDMDIEKFYVTCVIRTSGSQDSGDDEEIDNGIF